jgi:hypothetical protein
MVKPPVGSMWNQLKAAALATEAATPAAAPQTIATASTPRR